MCDCCASLLIVYICKVDGRNGIVALAIRKPAQICRKFCLRHKKKCERDKRLNDTTDLTNKSNRYQSTTQTPTYPLQTCPPPTQASSPPLKRLNQAQVKVASPLAHASSLPKAKS